MTGTPRKRRTFGNKIGNHEDRITSLERNRNITRIVSPAQIPFASGTGLTAISEKKYLPLDGGTIIGAPGWNAQTIIIATDTIDIAPDDSVSLMRPYPTVFLQPETGTTDDLVTITGAKRMQQELWIRGVNDTVTITVKNTGNIRTHDGSDFDIVGKKYYKFIYDIADQKWVQVTTLGTGEVFTWTADHTAANNSLTGLDALAFTDAGGQIAGSASTPHMNFVLTGPSTFRFTTNAENILDIDTNGLTMLDTNDVILGNNNISGVNQIAFNEPGQTITDSTSGIDIAVPTADTIDLVINANVFSFDEGFMQMNNNFMVFNDITAPTGTPTATEGYVFLDSADNTLKIKHNGSTVSLEGGGGADTALSNLAAVTINTNLVSDTDGTDSLGSSTIRWETVYADIFDIQDDLASNPPASGVTQIRGDQGGMNLGVAASNDAFDFFFGGSSKFSLIEDGEMNWVTDGHKIVPQATSLDIVAGGSGAVELWPGSSRSNEGLIVQDANSIFKNSTSGSAYQLLIQYSNATTTGQPAIGNIGFQAEDSANVQSAYAGIVTAIDDDTSTSRDGRMQLVVANGHGAAARGVTQITPVIDIQGGNGSEKLGFFGATPVVQQTIPAGATLSQVVTALRNLGLGA